ncbi:MAG: TolC family protein [Candidatus Zixiibacteriota bacterium]|nr:MAG: TolC family protein [candidate division Zixibacteria bacterium]
MLSKHLASKLIYPRLIIAIMIGFGQASLADSGLQQWQYEFDSTSSDTSKGDSLSFNQILGLVAEQNPILMSLDWKLKSAEKKIQQAGLLTNPELELEFEEVGWNAPGFKESEITFLLSQDLEFFGQRGARKRLAEVNLDVIKWENRKAAFGLYLDAKSRFFKLAHAQQQSILTDEAVKLSQSIRDNIAAKINKGAALQSELLLAELEFQKTRLDFNTALRERKNMSLKLSALWGDKNGNIVIRHESPCDDTFNSKTQDIDIIADSSAGIIEMIYRKRLLESETRLSVAEARPSVTLKGGYKRLESEKTNSFVLGISFPLPFINRNQGRRAGLKAEIISLQYEIEQSRLEASAVISSFIGRLEQHNDKINAIDTLLLPTAGRAYKDLEQAYNAGRIPYTSLLEGKRTLMNLRFEKNDLILSMRNEQIELERIIGITLDKNQNERFKR